MSVSNGCDWEVQVHFHVNWVNKSFVWKEVNDLRSWSDWSRIVSEEASGVVTGPDLVSGTSGFGTLSLAPWV